LPSCYRSHKTSYSHFSSKNWLPWQRPLARVDPRPTHDSLRPCPFPRRIWFLGPTRVLNPNGTSVDSAVFAGLTNAAYRQTERQSDRPTDRPTHQATRPVTIGRIYVRRTAMRPNNTTRHRASTTMYSPTFRVRVTTPPQYGRNGTASLQITSRTQQACRFDGWRGQSSPACV